MRKGATALKNVAAVILGGGRGTRLFPLTEERAKPAISFGGKYRLIDIPISNSINSGIRKIFVLTQFLSAGLGSHISRTYRMDGFSDGFVEILAAEQTPTNKDWYQGTADAVRQSMRYLLRLPLEHVLILSGDQLYRMDFRDILETHVENEADVTLAATLVPEEDVPRMGILKTDERGRVLDHVEKPSSPEEVERLAAPTVVREAFAAPAEGRRHLGSMGIYVFRKEALVDLLQDPSKQDFGREVLPSAFGRSRVVFHPFNGYWVDVGTFRSYFEANLDLASPMPAFDLYDPVNPLFSRPRYLPAAKAQGSRLDQCLIAEGSIIERADLSRVVVGLRSVIRPGAVIRGSVLMGNDYYAGEGNDGAEHPEIGRDTFIENTVIDKNVRIGDGCRITDKSGSPDFDGEFHYVREGIVVIPYGQVVPPGTVI